MIKVNTKDKAKRKIAYNFTLQWVIFLLTAAGNFLYSVLYLVNIFNNLRYLLDYFKSSFFALYNNSV